MSANPNEPLEDETSFQLEGIYTRKPMVALITGCVVVVAVAPRPLVAALHAPRSLD